VAICPASAEALARGARSGRFDVRLDLPSLEAFLSEHDERQAITGLEAPLLLLHAEGDEQVPVEHSRELATLAPNARLLAIPGGHHRSIQHDGELQGESLRWLTKVL
jgi:pimeloyl-ACP methyl ester carboxylesterase